MCQAADAESTNFEEAMVSADIGEAIEVQPREVTSRSSSCAEVGWGTIRFIMTY